MRVATLTFQSALNYGAALQAYALKEAIKELGHECDILNYKCLAIENAYKYFPMPHSFRGVISGVVNFSQGYSRKKVFGRFATDCLKLGGPVNSENISERTKQYDTFIVGSDQVWNLKLTGGDNAYILDFATGKKRVSYAASAGHGMGDLLKSETAVEAIRLFDSISVREEDLAKHLGSTLNRDIDVVLDPVFLVDADKWRRIAQKSSLPKPYVLAYGLHEPSVYSAASTIAEKNGWNCVYVPQGRSTKCDGIKVTSPTVQEFLGLIECAEAIVTDSFHVAAFSLLFERPLLVKLKTKYPGMNSRLTTLLENTGAADRIIMPQDNLANLDYPAIGEHIKKLRQASMAWLEKSLNAE